MNFKQRVPLKERTETAGKCLAEHPHMVPIIIEKHVKSRLAKLDKEKYLVEKQLKVFNVTAMMRKKLILNSYESLYAFVNDNILLKPSNELR